MAKKRSSRAKAPVKLDANTRVLVLHGKDEMAKRTHLDNLRAVLDKVHGEVEPFHFDGKSATLAEVFDELRSYSLMQTYKLVVVDDADQFVKSHREAVERYAKEPVDHAALVLRAGTWNRGNLDKAIAKVGAIIKCEPPSAQDAVRWLLARAEPEHNRKLEPNAASALVERMGAELMALDSELAKLALMVEPGKPITAKLVSEVVGRSSEEQAWSVQEAVLQAMGSRNAKPAVDAVHELVDLAGQPDILVMYFVVDLMRKFAVAASMKQAGANEVVIGKHLKLWGPRQQLFMRVFRQLPPEKARAMLAEAVRYDARSKSGLGNATRNLECFCAALTDNL